MPPSIPQPSTAPRGRSLIYALFAVFVWGCSYAVTRATVQEIPPFTLAFLRFALATLLVWPLARRRSRVAIAPEDHRSLFWLGVTGVTLYFGFENLGLKFTSASHGALIIATIPLFTETARALLHRKLPRPRILTGLLSAFAGVVLIVGHGGGSATLVGDLLVFGAVPTWVWYTFLAKRLVVRYPNLLLTLRIMAVGTLTLLPAALAEALCLPLPHPSLEAWGGVVFLGVLCSALAFHLWNQAIPALGVAATNNLLNGIPLVGVLAGVIALGEPLTANILCGGALIVGGVVLASVRHGDGNSY